MYPTKLSSVSPPITSSYTDQIKAKMVPTKLSSVFPYKTSSYTGPGKEEAKVFSHKLTKDFVHKWTVADFKTKMENVATAEKISSGEFTIGGTTWTLWLYPRGHGACNIGWVSLYLVQTSSKSVRVSWDWFTGRSEAGDFVKEQHLNHAWVDGTVDNDTYFGGARSGWGVPQFLSHREINSPWDPLVNGGLELFTRITVEEITDHTGEERSGRDEEVRREASCPVCFEVMRPPVEIWQCGLGHPICGRCKTLQQQRVQYRNLARLCPTCRKPLTGRSNMMEKLVKVLFSYKTAQ